jgi:hypothetical protein
VFVCAAAYPAASRAHHSTAEYDSSNVVEARGEVVNVLWRNPHVRLEISTQRFDGVAQTWQLEGQNPTDLDRAGIPRDVVKVGDTVKFAGNASTRRERRMYVTNVLLADQTEIALRANAPPRWSPDRFLSHRQATIDPARAAADRAEGIFRVWLPIAANTPDWATDPPLTEAARAAWKAYDAVRDDPVIDCRPPGMPQVITRSGRYAIRFERMGDDIVLKNEYREIDRIIHMTPGADAGRSEAATPLGHSTGRWDGESLVVTTTGISWPYFQLYGLEGVPQSAETTLRGVSRRGSAGLATARFGGSPAFSSCRRFACSRPAAARDGTRTSKGHATAAPRVASFQFGARSLHRSDRGILHRACRRASARARVRRVFRPSSGGRRSARIFRGRSARALRLRRAVRARGLALPLTFGLAIFRPPPKRPPSSADSPERAC